MPPPVNRSEFLQLLEKSALLEPQLFQKVVEQSKQISEKPSDLAEWLIRDGYITKFHADQLLAGRHKGFFVGKYKILRLIGQGGMGRVYLAQHKIMQRQCALKILPKTKGKDPSAIARFQREARAVAALNHMNIVQAYDIDKDDEQDLHYIVMEFVEGQSIQEIIKESGPIDWRVAADYICQSAAGLDHANRSGLVHRDIKPGNLLVDTNGVVKLLDMGLAVFFTEKDKDSITMTYNENVLGTADYLAPEQAIDSHGVDTRADIYSLGGTFYYMLSGGPPFPDGTIAQKLLWAQNKEPRSIQEFVPDLPDEVAAIIRKMMAKKPEDRYQNPLDLASALRPWAASNGNYQIDQSASGEYNFGGNSQSGSQTQPMGGTATAIASQTASDEVAHFTNGNTQTGHEHTTPFAPSEAEDFLKDIADSASQGTPVNRISGEKPTRGSSNTRPVPLGPISEVEPGSKNLVLVIAIVAVVILLGGGAGAYYFLQKPKPPAGPIAGGPGTNGQTPPQPPASNFALVPSKKFPAIDIALAEEKNVEVDRFGGNSNGWWELTNKIDLNGDFMNVSGGSLVTVKDQVVTLTRTFDTPFFWIKKLNDFTIKGFILDGAGKSTPLIIIDMESEEIVLEDLQLKNFTTSQPIDIREAKGKVTLRNVTVDSPSIKTPESFIKGRNADVILDNVKVNGKVVK